MIIDSAASSLGHFTQGVTHALHSLLLMVGIICLAMGFDRFKKRSERAGQATVSLVIFYTVFGFGLIACYFFL